ncbi:hypothetical protein Daus18300_002634 [Diaporthe australafricana]|uniref:Integral membrane protein n=1 Tax=Diaporthe australafricana TaxID=127596 RepID=A0ABR3XMN9_9PEZI
MVLGFRASYHPAQSASKSSYQSPLVCPCAACFDRQEHRQLREACESPAKEVKSDCGHSVPGPSPGSKRTGAAVWQRFGISLGRRRSAESMASARPLRTAAQDVPRISSDADGTADRAT